MTKNFKILILLCEFEIFMESFPSKICWDNKKERKSILEFDKSKHGFFTGLIIFRFEQTLGNDHINVGTAIPKEIKRWKNISKN